ncbi:MAG: hypothetical protein KatS3mg039_1118 [Candidatus Kapaibacterium sp.]|nr:MAG: hypothetical protein KatS3mg039_1118 [Candidatus Kapabacteria bacterium]
MIAVWFAWQLGKQYLWRSFQIALMAATMIVAALAAYAWLDHEQRNLDAEKRRLSVALVIYPTEGSSGAGELASDLRALAPELVARVEVDSDSVLAERLQSRYGMAIGDIAQDSLLPTVLRVYFHPEQLSQASFTAFIEQCNAITEVGTMQYPLATVTRIFQRQQELWWTQAALASGWLVLGIFVWWLHLRVTLPLDARSNRTLELLGAPAGMARRVRMVYAGTASVLGIAVATAIVIAVSVLLPHSLRHGLGFYGVGSAIAIATLAIVLAISLVSKPS